MLSIRKIVHDLNEENTGFYKIVTIFKAHKKYLANDTCELIKK